LAQLQQYSGHQPIAKRNPGPTVEHIVSA